MDLQNDSDQLKELLEEPESAEARNRERLRALYAISIGHSVPDVAEIFCVDEQTVYNWIEKWRDERDVSDKPKSGRPPAFTEEEKKELKKLVDENDPKKYGMNASCWDCTELHKYYLSRGKDVSSDAIERTLLEMGAHYRKAEFVFAEIDEDKRRAFALQFLRDMQDKKPNVVVLFGDEFSLCTSPHKGYGWTFNGRLVIPVSQVNKIRTNCFDAVAPIEGQIVAMTSKSAKAPAFVKFLRKIEAKYQNQEVWLYLDNCAVHKSRQVKEYLKKPHKIVLKSLPPYSPDINPVEELHKYDRTKLLNNIQFGNIQQLAMRLHWFLRKLDLSTVRSVCSLRPIETYMS